MSEKKLAEYYVKRLQELGAVRAKWIDPATVVTAAWVGHKCRFGCPTYGKNRCCPPNTPTVPSPWPHHASFMCTWKMRSLNVRMNFT